MSASSAPGMLRLKVSSNIENLHARGRALSRRIVQLLYSYQLLQTPTRQTPILNAAPATVL
jgi:hypothetical protein